MLPHSELKMAGVKRKLNVLSIEKKMEILNFLEENHSMKKNVVAEIFGIPPSTLSTIMKNKDSIRNNFDNGKKTMKKNRACSFPDVDKCVRKWFEEYSGEGVPISGLMLQIKAEDFAKELGLNNFKASNGWLESFKMRHGIVFRKLLVEDESVQTSVIKDWLETLPSLLEGYDPADIFNAVETGLFFQCFPNETAVFKGYNCIGGQLSKVRVTILLAANQTGTEKLLPVMIGRSAKPRCFANVKSFPCLYKSSKKSWMTREIFSEWLKMIDEYMGLNKRKILLFIDNCSSHKNLPTTKNITVQFLPLNTTLKLQPLDQGVIQSFKAEYRKQLVQKLLSAIEDGENLSSITILDAMRMIDYAWSCVTGRTIRNGFKKFGFAHSCIVEEQEMKEIEVPPNKEMDESPKEWVIIKEKLNIDSSFKDFIDVDESVVTSGALLTDSEILEHVCGTSDEEDDDRMDNIGERVVTSKEAEKAIETLRMFLESQDNIDQDCFSSLSKLQKVVQSKKFCIKDS